MGRKDILGKRDTDQVSLKRKTIVVGNHKYVYFSRSKHQQLQTWRCTVRSCKGRIYMTDDGNMAGASEDHNHDQLNDCEIQDVPPEQVVLDKEDTALRREKNKPDSPTYRIVLRAKRKSDGKIIVNKKDQPGDEGLVLPKLGAAFSIVDCPDVMESLTQRSNRAHSISDSIEIKKELEEEIYDCHQEDPSISSSSKINERNERCISQSSQPDRNYGFTVTKDTGVMRNILAETLERLTAPENLTTTHDEIAQEPLAPVASPSNRKKSSSSGSESEEQPESYQNRSSNLDHSYATKNPENQRILEPGKRWEQEEEIDVDGVSEDGDDLIEDADGVNKDREDEEESSIDEEEMAEMLGGSWF